MKRLLPLWAALALLSSACLLPESIEFGVAPAPVDHVQVPPGEPPSSEPPPSEPPPGEPPPTPSPPASPRTHTVQPGETLHALADRYGVTATALAWANELRGSRLEPGRTLTIPEGDIRPPLRQFQAYGGASVISRGAGTRRSVALTIDAGADRGDAERILNTLRDRGVRASFGMTGVWARQNPDLIGRMAAEGHQLINHSWDHPSFTGLSTRSRGQGQAERWSQLDRTDSLVADMIGQSTRPFFRAPYGDTDASVLRDIAPRGYAYNVLWTVDSGGWSGLNARQISDRCLRAAAPGAIYIFHVGTPSQDGLALGSIIDGLAAAGFDFETVEEIIVP